MTRRQFQSRQQWKRLPTVRLGDRYLLRRALLLVWVRLRRFGFAVRNFRYSRFSFWRCCLQDYARSCRRFQPARRPCRSPLRPVLDVALAVTASDGVDVISGMLRTSGAPTGCTGLTAAPAPALAAAAPSSSLLSLPARDAPFTGAAGAGISILQGRDNSRPQRKRRLSLSGHSACVRARCSSSRHSMCSLSCYPPQPWRRGSTNS